MPDYKSVPFELLELKADKGEMEFTGYASTFLNLDHQGDRILKNAFDDTLASGMKRRLLWSHDMTEPIGVEVSMRVDDKGLLGTWKLSRTTRGMDAYVLLQDKAIDSLSIGYRADEYEFDDDGARLLTKVTLYETSLVSIPANDQAVITAVKADQPIDVLARQVIANIDLFRGVAKALHSRRILEGRKPTERHIDAVKDLLSTCAQVDDELAALFLLPAEAKAEPPAPDPEVEAKGEERTPDTSGQSAPSADLSIRLALARVRLRSAGILEHAQ